MVTFLSVVPLFPQFSVPVVLTLFLMLLLPHSLVLILFPVCICCLSSGSSQTSRCCRTLWVELEPLVADGVDFDTRCPVFRGMEITCVRAASNVARYACVLHDCYFEEEHEGDGLCKPWCKVDATCRKNSATRVRVAHDHSNARYILNPFCERAYGNMPVV